MSGGVTDGGVTDLDAAVPTIRRVGPGGRSDPAQAAPMAADSAFGVALVGLWHAAARAGGAVGFAHDADRADIARSAAPIVEDLRRARALGVAADQGRRLVGVGLLRPGVGARAHTGRIELLAVDPPLTGCGLGRGLVAALLEQARDRGLERVTVEFAQDERVQRFFEQFGFVVSGRRPGWYRTGSGGERDEIVMGVAW